MPFITRDAIRIHYRTLGQGPPLLLHHGFSGSGDAWDALGYTTPLARRHTLILIDARGHGRSDKPHNPAAYTLRARALDVLGVLDDLGIDRTDFLGYSMGGRIGFALASIAPHRFNRFILGGAHPYPDDAWSAFRGIDGSSPAAFIAAFENAIGEPVPRPDRAGILANDLAALAATAQAPLFPGFDFDTLTTPIHLYAGEHDARLPRIRDFAETHPAPLTLLTGLTHIAAFTDADAVLHALDPLFADPVRA